jgi:LmbE family N-acetylglucosaminyl deacetylase
MRRFGRPTDRNDSLGLSVILSSHCDDAALSLGGWIARRTEQGGEARVVTVFANDPVLQLPLSVWDVRAGFATSDEAARVRRAEDRSALAVLGADAVHLPFPDSGYRRGPRLDRDEIVTRIVEAAAGASTIFLPGFPLIHPDHAWLTDLVVARKPFDVPLCFYVEQPYAWWNRRSHGTRPALESAHVELRYVRRKLAALRHYKSQLPLLGGRRLALAMLADALVGPGEAFVEAPTPLFAAPPA